ncbi:peptide chain release factor N(5)-glutamine methyltransferase [Micromonospora sp. C28SCA-DRY-2]|uniref:peptide chain release factor N(5)-glutamine methyltransferase n=1 Tax=Micromonospora sp. C28SCA-DRY-2 TaxID=3059522 RepID=UPI002674A882|nr:peptide chain release factor N(5)-glutamine methyltransferase [Micromonospora sp. C28SCA-DRY-2]MDO3702237.1 peptide chain release factor N(5)-glutamine methyltransferase [Micromonospora sp. C28SCA-DRY-2]
MTIVPQHPSEGTNRERPSVAVVRAARVLAEAGVAAARAEAELLAAYVLDVPRGRLALADGFTPAQRERYAALVARRADREPLQHLTGRAAFRHLELAVGPGVFVPRPETELLAGWGVEQAGTVADPLVVDLCSGSGAIALAVAQELPSARVVAVEGSPAALPWLRRNAAERAAAGDRPIEVVAADVTAPDLLAGLAGRVDVLLCNPPYVPAEVAVPPEVARHDPAEAVFGGPDGLAVIRPVVARAAALLRPGGALGVEHDDTHGRTVPELLAADGRYTAVTDHPDLTGRPRFATASRRADGRHRFTGATWQTGSS